MTTPHTMQLVRLHASGAEELHCPDCNRRILIHWPPTYRVIVLARGDEAVAHIAATLRPLRVPMRSSMEEWLGMRPVPQEADVELPAVIADYLRTL